MSSVAATIATAQRGLDAEGLGFALVGGFAVSARAEPRFTRDVDLAVAVRDDAQAEGLVRWFVTDGHHLVATVEQDAVGRLATARLRLRDGDPLDLLFASSGIEREVVDDAEPLEILPGVVLPVASIGHLIALKVLSRSPHRQHDSADLVALAAVADPEDRRVALLASAEIERRGYGRGRDLVAAVGQVLDGDAPEP